MAREPWGNLTLISLVNPAAYNNFYEYAKAKAEELESDDDIPDIVA